MKKQFREMTDEEQRIFFTSHILDELKRLGGQADKKNLKKSFVKNYEILPENTFTKFAVSKKKKNHYHPADYPFNYSLKYLLDAGYLDRPIDAHYMLTEKGRQYNGTGKELYDKVMKEDQKPSKSQKTNQEINNTKYDDIVESSNDVWRDKLLTALEQLTSAKFEMFCRALVRKMNVDIDEKIGVKQSGDGGIDGYGYMTTDDFRTTRVAIQAKKWNLNSLVSSPEIDKFRGAMDKYRAEYGIFITTSSFTRDAIHASRTGSRVITLIDGEHLADLVTKYELYVKPVVTYELDDFFNEKN